MERLKGCVEGAASAAHLHLAHAFVRPGAGHQLPPARRARAGTAQQPSSKAGDLRKPRTQPAVGRPCLPRAACTACPLPTQLCKGTALRPTHGPAHKRGLHMPPGCVLT